MPTLPGLPTPGPAPRPTSWWRATTSAASCLLLTAGAAAAQDAGQAPVLPFPGLLKRAEREAGNPLATYAEMLRLEARYREPGPFADIYPEVRCNYEEFLGDQLACV